MKFTLDAPKVEVRTSLSKDKKKSLHVKARALVPNVNEIFKSEINQDGKRKSFKSLFTSRCLDQIKSQAKSKPFFVDAMHQTAFATNTKRLLKEKGVPDDDIEKVASYFKVGDIPLFRLNDMEFTDDAMVIDFNMNPVYRDLDDNHQKYYDAIEYSLQNGYLKGVSANFNVTDVEGEEDDMQINGVDLYGFSVMDATANPDTNIMEVAVRTMMEFRTQEGGNMSEENEKKMKDLEERANKAEDALKAKDEEVKKAEEAKKTEDETKQKEDWKKQQEDMQKQLDDKSKKLEELQKAQAGDEAKGTVAQGQDKYGDMKKNDQKASITETDALKKVKEDFDVYVEGEKAKKLGKPLPIGYNNAVAGMILQLGADTDAHLTGIDPMHKSLLGKSDSDIDGRK